MREKVCEFIKKHCALEEEVTEESKLRELSLDSLSFVQDVVDIEAEMGIEFEIEELNIDNWEKVGDIIKVLETKNIC